MVNHSRNYVADELLFTASQKFFNNMSEEDIMKWEILVWSLYILYKRANASCNYSFR